MQIQIRCTLSWTLGYGKHTRVHIALKPPLFLMSCIPHNIQSFILSFFSFFFKYKNTSAYYTSYWKKRNSSSNLRALFKRKILVILVFFLKRESDKYIQSVYFCIYIYLGLGNKLKAILAMDFAERLINLTSQPQPPFWGGQQGHQRQKHKRSDSQEEEMGRITDKEREKRHHH